MRKYSFSVDGFNFERINKAATLGTVKQYNYKYMEV